MRKMTAPTINQSLPKASHPFMSKPELILGKVVRFQDPKTGERLEGKVFGVDTRPFAGGADGEYLIVQLPPKKDPYAPGEVLRLPLSSCQKI